MDMLSYYGEKGIIPVHQYLPQRDYSMFKFQREMLYSNLGLHPGGITGRTVLEVGPGTGDNARVIADWQPRELHLVDGNPASIQAVYGLMDAGLIDRKVCSVSHSDARDYLVQTEPATFDIVICEGVINGNSSPAEFIRLLARSVKPGGLLLITTVSAWGVLDQALRRLYLPAIASISQSFGGQVEIASDVFGRHLRHLPTTKPVEDWVQDAILHPLGADYLFSSEQALGVVGDDFVVSGSSPRMFSDYRWHKSLNPRIDDTNERFCSQFRLLAPMLLDDRLADPFECSVLFKDLDLEHLHGLARDTWFRSSQIVLSNTYDEINPLVENLQELEGALTGVLPSVARSLRQFMDALPNISIGDFRDELPYFEQWWGRGLQYLGLRRL